MKLLLTSAGLLNPTLVAGLTNLTGQAPAATSIGFITTAQNYLDGTTEELYDSQLEPLRRAGFAHITTVDPARYDNWPTILANVDVVIVGGGNTFNLLNQLRLTDFPAWLHQNIERITYVGVSAGSILITPSIGIAPIDNGDEDLWDTRDLTGFGLVDFEVSPHSPEEVSYAANAAHAKSIKSKFYTFDNQTAVRVVDGQVEMVGGGEWKVYNG